MSSQLPLLKSTFTSIIILAYFIGNTRDIKGTISEKIETWSVKDLLLARSPRRSTGDKSGLSFWIVLWLSVCKFSHFIQYSTVEYSTVQYKAAGPPSRDCSECDYRICSRVNLKTHYQTNCNGCAKRFCSRRHLKTHNTFREAVRLYNILAHSTQWSTGL